MTRLFALAWLAAVILALALWQARRRPPEAWCPPAWRADWNDPAMDVYDRIQPPDLRTWELRGLISDSTHTFAGPR